MDFRSNLGTLGLGTDKAVSKQYWIWSHVKETNLKLMSPSNGHTCAYQSDTPTDGSHKSLPGIKTLVIMGAKIQLMGPL